MTQVLVDASIWIDHLRAANADLVALLRERLVLGHPWVVGELGLGNLADRTVILRTLARLPQAKVATHAEVMTMIEEHRLSRRGLGYVDTHLLAATRLTVDSLLWTRDRRLRDAAADLDVAYASV